MTHNMRGVLTRASLGAQAVPVGAEYRSLVTNIWPVADGCVGR